MRPPDDRSVVRAKLCGKGLRRESIARRHLECGLHTLRSTMGRLGVLGKIDCFDGTHPGGGSAVLQQRRLLRTSE